MKPLNCKEVEYEKINDDVDGGTNIRLKLPYIEDKDLPSISIVVPTYNRPEFLDLIMANWDRSDYPREKMEMIILDDSPTKSSREFEQSVRYIHSSKKLTIGEKRNKLCEYANNEYIVHMDDDDWYPSSSFLCRIRTLLYFQKKLNKLCCFGCDKVLCIDLISNQMFEAFDPSSDGTPATISESTLAYSKKYWSAQKWDNASKMTECLPFVSDRYDTLCTCHSVYIVTQFSHTNNTVKRNINKSSVSSRSAMLFQENMSLYDSTVFNKIRASVICKIPSYKKSIEFISKVYDLSENQLKSEYSLLDEDIKSNPLVINYIQEKFSTKTKCSGKDVTYYCGPGSNLNFSNKWNPETSIGGSEEAVVGLSSTLAKRGYNVTVFCVLKGPVRKFENVLYRPYYEWIPKDAQDITIIWRDPSNCEKFINSKKIFLDIHDVIEPMWLKNIHVRVNIMLKSRYHKSIIPSMKNPIYVIPNGIHPLSHTCHKTSNLIICTSSPDRCIVGLLKATPMIRKKFPDAQIHWAYGFSSGVSEGGMENNSLSKDWVVDVKERIKKTKGFKDLGKLSQDEVRKLYERADMFIYPTLFPEIDCISLTKAMSAGCIPVVTPSGAMAEKIGYPTQVAKLTNDTIDYSLSSGDEFNKFVDNIIVNLRQKNINRERIANDTNKKYNWETITDQWIKLF